MAKHLSGTQTSSDSSMAKGSTVKLPKGDPEVILSAGGLLWRESKEGKQLAVVHRRRHDDWTLPKGKVDDGETWTEAALREVLEETNCRARLGSFAGCTCYSVGGAPKVVLFWNMSLLREDAFRANRETDQLSWLTVEEALEKLDYAGEKALLPINTGPS